MTHEPKAPTDSNVTEQEQQEGVLPEAEVRPLGEVVDERPDGEEPESGGGPEGLDLATLVRIIASKEEFFAWLGDVETPTIKVVLCQPDEHGFYHNIPLKEAVSGVSFHEPHFDYLVAFDEVEYDDESHLRLRYHNDSDDPTDFEAIMFNEKQEGELFDMLLRRMRERCAR